MDMNTDMDMMDMDMDMDMIVLMSSRYGERVGWNKAIV